MSTPLIDVNAFAALQEEVWAFVHAIHDGRQYPTIYRHGKTYLVRWAFYESGKLWYECYELLLVGQTICRPLFTLILVQCANEFEWVSLLLQSSLRRHPYFTGHGRTLLGYYPIFCDV